MTAAPHRAPSGATLRLLEEAQRLYNLLTDGHSWLTFAMSRGCPLRDARTKSPRVWSYVGRGVWRAARDVHPDGTQTDRQFNPYVLRKHLIGDYDVAFEWPSWTSLVVFDIDRHLPEGMSEEDADPWYVKLANEQRDETVIGLWRALDLGDKEPVVLKTPRGGYHVYLPLCRTAEGTGERTWPAAWVRERIIHRLNQHGIELRPGQLELWPSGTRLRAPCGQGMKLLDSEFEPREGTYDERRGSRRVGPMVRQFCEAIEAARKPLETWLGESEPCWDAVYGPFSRKKIGGDSEGVLNASRHKVDVQPVLCPEGGLLLFGRAFVARVQALARDGLTGEGERHDGALKLVWYWAVCLGLDESEIEDRLANWLHGFEHQSHLLPARPRKFFTDTWREAVHYLRHRVLREGSPRSPRGGSSRTDVTPPPLAPPDESALGHIALEVRDEARAILRHLASHADGTGRVPHPVTLSGAILAGMCGERRIITEVDGVRARRRAYVIAVEQLVDLGVLALHTNYSTGRHGKRYTCWYQFGSGRLPQAAAADAGGDGALVLAERDIEEGCLQVLSDGPRAPVVRLFARPAPPPGATPRRSPGAFPAAPAATSPAPATTPPATDDTSPVQLELPGMPPAPEAPGLDLDDAGGCMLAATLHRSAAPSEPIEPAAASVPDPSEPAAAIVPPAPAPDPLIPLDDPAKPLPWWVRMYQRRAFTPCEFFEADARRVIPGPFAHRFGEKKRGQPTLYPGPVPIRPPPSAEPAPDISPKVAALEAAAPAVPEPTLSAEPAPNISPKVAALEAAAPAVPEPRAIEATEAEIPPEAAMLPPGALRNAVIAAWASWNKANGTFP